ncbi:MAG: cytochrome c biogenesis heme-transporting ATPase CcmA [Gammaproteobacteria bacterium]
MIQFSGTNPVYSARYVILTEECNELPMNLPGYDKVRVIEPDYTSTSGHSQSSLGVNGLACSRGEETLIRNINFTVHEGELLQIEGENGSGKSTLLKTLCGFIAPDAGEILWGGVDIKTVMDDYLAGMHYVGHSNGIKLGLTCHENLKVASALAGAVRTTDLVYVLDQYGLVSHADTPAQFLSSGQRRRLALARLSVCQAQIWILDEPFTSLDENGKVFVKAIFAQHLASGGIIIMTSHENIRWDGIDIMRINL